MFKTRPITTESPTLPRFLKQFSADGYHLPLKKNWSERWCTLPLAFENILDEVLDFEVRSDDIFIVTFMKSGTTWMQETVWLLMNNLDFETSKRVHLFQRSPFLDQNGLSMKTANGIPKMIKKQSSPRVIKSHLPANLLPRQIWQRQTKIIYVARNCKDVITSSYHFIKDLGFLHSDDFDVYVNQFLNNEIPYTNYWAHVLNFWQMRHQSFIFFVTYEEMKRDQAGVLQRLCTFLGRPQLTPEQMKDTLNNLSFESMKGNKQTNLTDAIKTLVENPKEDFEFMRRGIVGSYKDEMHPELQAKIDTWSRSFLAQYGLREEDIFGEV